MKIIIINKIKIYLQSITKNQIITLKNIAKDILEW